MKIDTVKIMEAELVVEKGPHVMEGLEFNLFYFHF